jgi:uncharacterized protein (TIGR03437 family)
VQRFITLIFIVATAACAQERPATCNPAVPVTPTVRMEGVTELTGDIVITCTGGAPTAVGQPVALTNLTLTLNTTLTSRILANGASEAMLLLDEPTAQSACATPIAGCPITGTGGINLYDGSPGHPNIFQAQQISPTTLAWYNLPLDAPGQTATHILRITNVRVNANAAAVSTGLQPSAIQATIAISSPLSIGLAAPTQIVANTQPGLQTSFQGTTLQQCGQSPLTAGLYPTPASITLTEGFPGAFKQAAWAPATGGTLANWLALGATSESGFVPLQSSGVPSPPGPAGTGTAFVIVFQNLPVGVNAGAPLSMNLLDPKSNIVGTVSTVVRTGVVSIGAASAQVVEILAYVSTVTATTALKSVTIPITFSGTAPSLPVTISANAGFYDSSFPQMNLFAATSTSYNSIPVFGSLDSGISTPPAAPAQPVATVADCTQTTPSLGTNGQPLAVFQITGPVTPRVYNIPLLSSGPPVSNLQLIKDPAATWLNATLSSTTTPASILLSANPETANFNTSLQVLTTAPVGAVALPVSFSYVQGPWFTRYGFTNSASYVAQAVAPGEPFLIGGYNFSTVAESNLTLGANGFVTTTLGGVQVMFDSVPAPLQFTVNINGTGYVAGYVPFELANQGTTNVHLIYNGAPSPPVTLNVINAVPAIFSVSTTGGGQGAILNQDFSLNGQGNGALPGQLVYIYGGGAGQTAPPGRTGGVTGVGAPVANLNLPVTVFIDGVEATDVPYAGPAPSLIEGVFQVNVRIPPNARTGASLPVVIQVGDKVTQPGVTVYVQ